MQLKIRHTPARYSLLSLLCILLHAAPAQSLGLYYSRDITGTVVEAGTGRPLEGVVVTASWILLPHFLDTTVPVRTLKASEAVTDQMGRYGLPGFFPGFSFQGYLREDQPLVRFFKDGYAPLVVANNSVYHPGFEEDTDHLIRKEFSYDGGRTGVRIYEPEEHRVRFGRKPGNFTLTPFAGSDADYATLLASEFHGPQNYLHSLYYLRKGNDCEWKHLPVTFSRLHRLKQRLDAEGVQPNGLPYVSHMGNQSRCGNAAKLFSEYLK